MDNKYNKLLDTPLIIKVPPVENISAASAKEILSTAGLSMIINDSVFSETVMKDYVVEQNPGGNAEVESGSSVMVVVSMGPENILTGVPNLAGLDIDSAAKTVEEAGFKLGAVSEEYSSTAEPGTVIFQDPEYGQSRQPGTEIGLIVSKGEELVSVPNLVGYDYVYVRANLESLDLRVMTERKTNINYPPGTVIDILPAPGNEISKYETVKITISTTEELISVPDVVSKSLQQAEGILIPLNIRYEISYINVDYSIQKNSVISQYPEAGFQMFPGDSIILFVGQ